MRCPTFTFKNKKTGRFVVINQSDYNDSRYRYLTNLSNLNDWERIGESGAGGDEGYLKSKEISDIAIEIKDKRAEDKLGEKIKFSG